MRESKIELYLVGRSRELGGDAIKLGVSSWPDRIVVLPPPDVRLRAAIGWCELKAPGQAPRRAQELRLAALRGWGCFAGAAASYGEVESFLQGLRAFAWGDVLAMQTWPGVRAGKVGSEADQ